MRRSFLFYLPILLLPVLAAGQEPIRVILPSAPVIAGESFRVQYVVPDAARTEQFQVADFRPFRVVSGPDIYLANIHGDNRNAQAKNYSYTLLADRPGSYPVPLASALYQGHTLHSNPGVISVLSRQEAWQVMNRDAGLVSDYFLGPGENVAEKIRKNLFLRVQVDKQTCYIGEPVQATFKLYSRLESRSDIVKNPGFYGFTVFDMVSLSDKLVTAEQVNGKWFDVHTIRKVQLFPLRAGRFTIDPMELTNRVEFSRSMVYKKPEQDIREGVPDDTGPGVPGKGTEVFETNLHTNPVEVLVKEHPGHQPPGSFSGAVGVFTVSATMANDRLARNEEGTLDLCIQGKGNFIQLNAPVIPWPDGVEGFEPVKEDRLDRHSLPLAGSRLFRYSFVSARPGAYTIPPMEISFFNPRSGRYETVFTDTLRWTVSERPKESHSGGPGVIKEKTENGKSGNRAGPLLLLLSAILVVFYFLRRRYKPVKAPGKVNTTPVPALQELLMPARVYIMADDQQFYTALGNAIWTFISSRFRLAGSEMTKERVMFVLGQSGVAEKEQRELAGIIEQCEQGKFTKADLLSDKKKVLERAGVLLRRIEESLF